jgi:type II secretory pathway component PulF
MLFYGLVLLAVIAAFPFSLAVVQGALASMDVQEKAGGTLPAAPTLMAAVQKTMIAMAPTALAGFAGLFVLWKLWHGRRLTPARHRLVLLVPILAGRAKAESLARFGWIMSMLARGGAPPNVCLQVAAASMPNLELARRMMATAATMKENERLSAALQRSDLLTPEYRNVVENGELTGDVPGAVMNMARATSAEFEARDKSFAHLSGMLFYIPFGLLILLLAVFLYKTWYGGIMDRFLPE